MLPKLVLDTNTFISAFFWNGNEAELLRKIEQGKATLYITWDILKEVEDVLQRPKFSEILTKTKQTSIQILQKIISLSHLVITTNVKIRICRDEKDNKFLECATSAKADFIVSGDEDLLSLKEYNKIQIVKTSKILEILNK